MLRASVPVAIGLLAAIVSGGVRAQITVDGTLSPARTLTGPQYAITADLGRQLGANLFHSFGQFNLNASESATFSGPNSVANILARVTGGSASSINGTIASTILGANLFLINPAGLMFGPNAQINVPGSFHAATADYLRFADNAVFSATSPSGSTLTAAAPRAFGFLSNSPAALSVDGSTLAVPTGQQLSLVGGTVTISGGTVLAPAGPIHIASAAGPGQIPVDPTDVSGITAPLGSVNIIAGSVVDGSDTVSGASGGAIYIRGGQVTVDASIVQNLNGGIGPDGPILLRGDAGVSLTGGTLVQTASPGGGNLGAIIIEGGAVTVDASAVVSTVTGSAAGGGITIGGSGSITLSSAANVEVDNYGSGTPGNILLQGGQINLTGASTVVAQAFGDGAGAAITLSGSDIFITAGALVFSSTSAQGDGGNITVAASGSVTMEDTVAGGTTGIASVVQAGATGNGGAVNVQAGTSLSLTAGGAIISETDGAGNAGAVSANAGTIIIDASTSSSGLGGIIALVDGENFGIFLAGTDIATGNTGAISVQATGSVSLTGGGVITSLIAGAGSSGAVSVQADALTITGTAGLGSQGIGSGDTGDVTVVLGGSLQISDFGGIGSQIFAGPGNAGIVSVRAGSISITDAAAITSTNFGVGNAGTVNVTTTGALEIRGNASIPSPPGITSDAQGVTGSAGDVTVEAASITLADAAEISSSAWGTGNAGAVNVTTGALSMVTSVIVSQANPGSSGNGGAVNVHASSISMSSTAQIISNTFGSGNGGTVNVTTGSLSVVGDPSTLFATGILSQSALGSGNAGAVTVQAGAITLTQSGVISSGTKGSGNAGTVIVNAGSIFADGAGSGARSPAGIDSSSSPAATGDAGSVAVSAQSLILMRGATISTSASGSANGGNVTVDISGDALLQGHNELGEFVSISALAAGTGTAGSIAISARHLTLLDGATITTEARQGGGGNITIHAGELLHLVNSSITTSVQGGTGNGGNIVIDPPAVVLDHSSIIAQAFGGNGGNISIDAQVLIQSPDSLISASSQLGISGAITIAAPSADVTASLAELSGKVGEPPQIARAGCASPARIEKVSRLVEGGRGGLPPDADAPLPGSYFGNEIPSAALHRRSPQQFAASPGSGRVTVACR